MFDCGISTTMSELTNQIRKDQENFIVSAVQEMYVNIDKEKLEKCLYESKSYFDDGYREGFDDGFNAAILQMKHKLNKMYAEINNIEMEGDEDETSE